MNKKVLRENMLQKRSSINTLEKNNMDKAILENLVSTELYKKSNKIFIYVSSDSEVNTKDIIELALKSGKEVYVPKTIKEFNQMRAVKINSLNELTKGSYGILEPKEFNKIIRKDLLDLIILPGVAFNNKGNRVGYGGGYYDRYLKEISCKKNKIALAYDFQVINKLENEDHDIRVDCIITNRNVIYI